MEVFMDNALVTELRSMTATALIATSAAERADWQQAAKYAADLGDRAHRVCGMISSTTDELDGNGECRSGTNAAESCFCRTTSPKECPMIKYVLTATILLGSVTAATAAEYYIVRGPDKKCKVVEKRPTEKTVVVIGDKAYVSREEATKQVAVVCKERP
jgi:hypothetical protein